MSLSDCAELVQRADPERFQAVMAAPPAARAVLFPIFAVNVELARAAWVASEPLIAEMRLQWWRDMLDGIATGGAAPGHLLAGPLAEVLTPAAATALSEVAHARGRDAETRPFTDTGQLQDYLRATGGGLMWAAASALGAQQGETAIRNIGYASGLANWLRAVPELRARGRQPLPDDTLPAIAALAREGRELLVVAGTGVPKLARPATRSGWLADRVLVTAASNPAAVSSGGLHPSEFHKRASLLWRVVTGAP